NLEGSATPIGACSTRRAVARLQVSRAFQAQLRGRRIEVRNAENAKIPLGILADVHAWRILQETFLGSQRSVIAWVEEGEQVLLALTIEFTDSVVVNPARFLRMVDPIELLPGLAHEIGSRGGVESADGREFRQRGDILCRAEVDLSDQP